MEIIKLIKQYYHSLQSTGKSSIANLAFDRVIIFISFIVICTLSSLVKQDYSFSNAFVLEKQEPDINEFKQSLQYLAIIGCLLWVIIYIMFKGLKNTFNLFNRVKGKIIIDFDEGVGVVEQDNIDEYMIFMELIPLVIPFILIILKYKITVEYIDKQINNYETSKIMNTTYDLVSKLRTNINQQLERDSTIVQTIPLILFGVGLVFENQKFYHNKFLLGGVFFGTGIPLMIQMLFVQDENIGRLYALEMTQFIFLSFGITMVVQALLKYYIFTKHSKEINKKIQTENIQSKIKNCFDKK